MTASTPRSQHHPAELGVAITPAPVQRLVAEDLLQESDRPRHDPGAPPPGGWTASARAAGGHLVDVHDHLRDELTRLRELVGQVRDGVLDVGAARGEVSRMTLRQNAWTLGAYCASYCTALTGHHGLEDGAIFPHLRRAEPALAPVVDRLEHEHRVVHDLLEGLDRALVAMASRPEHLDGVQLALDRLTDVLLSHLSYEESQLVDPLARHGFYAGQV